MKDYPIQWHPSNKRYDNCKFSIIIPSWNNIAYLEGCITSIHKNSRFTHQIIVHVNEGTDGTLAWIKQEGYDYTYSPKNSGICWGVNACRSLVQTDYIVYMNDDMYVLPDWDYELWREIEKLPDNTFFLSATMIEPKPSVHSGIISPCDYGQTIETFEEDRLLHEYQKLTAYDWSGATWPPNVLHKQMWDLIGGFSVEFSPGMYSDPDFSMKLIKAGVTYFKGVAKSRVYHFGTRSTNRVQKNNGSKQFLNKWGITASVLTKYCLNWGEKFNGGVNYHLKSTRYKQLKLKSKIKRIFLSFSSTGQVDEF